VLSRRGLALWEDGRAMNAYDAIARAEEGGWDIEVPAADGSHT
jgi:hypothetical protein